jgi:AraC-like DNA-binding protein
MTYAVYQPHRELSHCIECYWSYTADSDLKKHNIIVPDNCSDILIDFNQSNGPISSFIGTMTKPVTSVKTDVIGIRFNPGYAYSFFGIPMSEFTDIDIRLTDFWKPASLLEDELGKRKNISQKIGFLQEILLKNKTKLMPLENRFSIALKKLSEKTEYDSVESLGLELNISRQHLRRLFLKYMGINPVLYMRICRIRKVLKHMKQLNNPTNFSHIAQDFGYYDQSHMIADFHEFTGSTPLSYYLKKE